MSGKYDYDQCNCGNTKAKKSKTCNNCYKANRPVGSYHPYNLCQCGDSKKKRSKFCQECRNELRHKWILGLRGPLPKDGEAAIYLLRGEDHKVFYVGSSKTPWKRVTSHRHTYGDVTMLIIKIVPIEDQWKEEVAAMVHYGIVSSAKQGRF